MGKASLRIGQKFKWNNEVFKITALLPDGLLRVESETFGGGLNFEQTQIVEALEKGELRFEVNGKNTKKENGFSDHTIGLIGEFDEKEKSDVKFRWEVIKPIVQGEKTVDERVDQLNAIGSELLNGRTPPNRATIYRWLKVYKESSGSIRSLASQYFRCGGEKALEKKFSEEVESVIQDIFHRFELNGESLTTKTIWEHVAIEVMKLNQDRNPNEQLTIPSESTIWRRLKELDPFERDRLRYGNNMAYQKHGYVQTTEKPTRILERVEIDHTKIDLQIVDDKTGEIIDRPYLTAMIDCYSRSILGFHIGFDPPSFVSVLYTLKHAIRQKTYVKKKYPFIQSEWDVYGVPEKLVTDRGKEFTGKHLEDACYELGIELEFCKPRAPWLKGEIERFFRTLNQELFHQLPGTTFSNSLEKKMKNYNSEKKAVISLETLNAIVHMFVIDYYNVKKHRGLRNLPKYVWEDQMKIFPPKLPASIDWEMYIGKIGEGTIQRTGIRFQYLDYNSRELYDLRKKLTIDSKSRKVTFKFDPANIGSIQVYDSYLGRYITIPCTEPNYAEGLSEYSHRIIMSSINEKDRENRQLRIETKAKMYEMIQEEAHHSKSARRMSKRLKLEEPENQKVIQERIEVQEEKKEVASKKDQAPVIHLFNTNTWGNNYGNNVRKVR